MGGTPWGEGGLIKPGPGPGVNELLRSANNPMGGPSYVSPQQIAEARVRDEPWKYGDKIYEGAPDWRFTTVTVAQEWAGKNEVRRWMWNHLRRHRCVTGGGIDSTVSKQHLDNADIGAVLQ